jgi:hypothetical protein
MPKGTTRGAGMTVRHSDRFVSLRPVRRRHRGFRILARMPQGRIIRSFLRRAFVRSFPLAGLACAAPDTPPRSASAQDSAFDTTAVAPAWSVPPSPAGLTCEPSRVRASDTLVMRMPVPHGPTFHISAPDQTPFIVVFHGEGQPDRTQRRSLLAPDDFRTMSELRLHVGTLKAGVWVFGRDTNELVFTRPGMYRLRVGSDMETDGPIYAECLVRFVR